ncbi:MAG: S41 family peptidase [Elusimicrobiales bacterium]|jgi:carboxyl-terminal processing protease|nr:S41 family peptidase [Elusimicrobiales bacterium]
MKIKKVFFVSLIVAGIGFSIPYVDYAVDSTYQKIKVFIEAFEIVKDNYVDADKAKDTDLIYSGIAGMVGNLDPYSQFLTPKAYDMLMSETEGEFGGVGIQFEMKDGFPIVITPIPNTPAFKAKIYPGDRIIKIEGKTTENMLRDEIMDSLRGKPGTKVKITIAREPEKKGDDWNTFDVELTRAIIKVESVKYKMMDDNIGLIRVIDFNAHVADDFSKALKELSSKDMKKLVIDLRYNPGGLLVASIDMAKMFLDNNKMIVYTKGRTSKDYNEYRADAKAPYPSIPVAIVVNKYSASASEIFSGALKDNKRATIVGENTYGKASVQTVIPLSDKSAVRLTIAKYYTPSGTIIQRDPETGKGGITPDVEVSISKDEELNIYNSMQEIYYPDDKSKKEDKKIEDKVLNKAIEILKNVN